MSSRLNIDGILLFEQPFARVPYESYRKTFRASRETIEREMQAVQTSSTELSKRVKKGDPVSSQEALKALEAMIVKVEGLKRKLAELQEGSAKPTQCILKERIEHLAELENMQQLPSGHEVQFDHWADKRLDRWLVDWALRNGRQRTAKKIASEREIERLVDIDLFSDIRRIESALSRRSCSEALSWCKENKAALGKIKSTLEFELRMQEYIELARARKTQEAIAYSRKHLVTWHESHLQQIQQASALLAFGPSTACGPYKRLYESSRWATLIQSFRLAIYTLNTLPTEPLLNLALYAGLAALKLPSCFDASTKNVDCPVCDCASCAMGSGGGAGLGKLAAEVPFSHHVNSTIVCRLSGRIMDEDNTPMALPNGYVYSRLALEEMAARNGGKVTCPRTGETYNFSMMRKMFIS